MSLESQLMLQHEKKAFERKNSPINNNKNSLLLLFTLKIEILNRHFRNHFANVFYILKPFSFLWTPFFGAPSLSLSILHKCTFCPDLDQYSERVLPIGHGGATITEANPVSCSHNYTFVFNKFLGKDNLSGQVSPAEKASCTVSSINMSGCM